MVVRMVCILLCRISMATIQRGTSNHITYDNVLNTHVHFITTSTWTPLKDPASQELTWVTSKREHPNMDPASWKLAGEEKSRPTTPANACSLKLIGELIKPIQEDACSLKLIGELMIQVFSFTRSTLTMIVSQRTSSPQDYGEDYNKENFPPSHGVPERFFGYWTN